MSFDVELTMKVLLNRKVSIPLEQGNVFRLCNESRIICYSSFNPFGTGQCLSTKTKQALRERLDKFQSLWNRAMSFDKRKLHRKRLLIARFNPFGTGQCLSTISGLIILLCVLRFNPFGTGQCLSAERNL